jgi:4a-hydroxytetrahydrobiopterin dehydratase
MAILSDEQVREELARRPAWRRSGDTLIHERALRDFAQALAFVERIGDAVEDYGRHPDIAITGGNRVRVMVSNANAAGITDAELRLVDKVDQVADAPAPEPKPRGALAAVASASSAVEVVTGGPADDPDPEPEAHEPEPRRGGRVARIAAGLGGLAVGAAALFMARRR